MTQRSHAGVRVAVLWEHLTGYVQAMLRGLESAGARLLVVQRRRWSNADFDRFSSAVSEIIHLDDIQPGEATLEQRLEEFRPDIALITANKDRGYLAAARAMRRRGALTIWATDLPARPWWRDLRSLAAGRSGHWRDFEAAFVPGAMSVRFARRSGFKASQVFTGLYTCDAALFRPVGIARHASTAPWPPVFLFVGQLVERKGLRTLAEAYRRYRAASSAPWELWCAGTGPLRGFLESQPGMRVLDFLAPSACAEIMAQAGALVLPSYLDHWGVVIHEAVCAGLPVIATSTAYATLDLVEDGCNGFVVPPRDISRLAQAMGACSNPERARTMGEAALHLSYRFDPSVFARRVLHDIPAALAPAEQHPA